MVVTAAAGFFADYDGAVPPHLITVTTAADWAAQDGGAAGQHGHVPAAPLISVLPRVGNEGAAAASTRGRRAVALTHEAAYTVFPSGQPSARPSAAPTDAPSPAGTAGRRRKV
eukprot:gene13721-25863_t